ncbi:MAG: HDOD domain-containing protein [Chitinispirillia bacterium]|nr:HDOD domain-containing protein [Chitinispirillia bacterium]
MYRDIEELQDKIKAIANLPTLPHIAAKLMKLINSPSTSAELVASLIAQDVSLSAKVLRLANSAFYGIPKSINTLKGAVVVLGFKILHTMVLSLTVFDMFGKSDRKNLIFDREAFWQHSLKCAAIARLLAKTRQNISTLDPEEAFCTGLLHDVGKVVMEQYLHTDFHKALLYARTHQICGFEAEKQVLDYTHCDVALWLTASWSLPEEIQQPLVYHHEPDLAQSCGESVMLCHIADCLSYAKDEFDINELLPQIKALGITTKDLKTIIEKIPAEMEKASDFII